MNENFSCTWKRTLDLIISVYNKVQTLEYNIQVYTYREILSMYFCISLGVVRSLP